MSTLRLIFAIATTGLVTLHAQPTGGQVTAGTGTIAAAGNLTQINQTSNRLIIDWSAFSIPQGSAVNFTQPGAMAAVLNRVTGHDTSALLGTLSANGQVYLLNPNGVLIGATGRITTAGFIASTAHLSNADFLRGSDLAFGGGSGAAIVNQGEVSSAAGPIVFIARRVENSGSLSTPGGVIQLVGGTEVLLATPDSPALILAGSQAGEVSNAGAIAAAQVRLQAVGNNAAALAINQTGVIRATGVEQRGGEVWLVGSGAGRVTQQGEISARNADGTGGTIRATGGQLLIASGSKTDASGPVGGGGVELGGAERGATLISSAANARETLVESGAVISADALAAGDGGRVILWGTDALGFYGSVSARGASGGPGGFVETSGGWLDLSGRVETGLGGRWLIDPFNIRIVDGPSSGFAFSGTNPVVGRPTSSESRLDVRVLEQALESQGKVVIDTGGAGNDVGNIIIDTPLFYQGREYARLSLNAANDIYVNQPITSSDGSLDLDFNADFDANGQGKIILGSDLITLGGTVIFQENVVTTGNAGLAILSGGGDIIFAGDLRLENLDGLDLSSQGGDILMASLSSGTQRNAILRLTDLGPRNLYTNIAALLANPVRTPEATIGEEAGRLVKRRSLRRVNNPPGYQTVAWMGYKQGAGQGSLISPGNFGPTQVAQPPKDDSYMDAPFLTQVKPPAGNTVPGNKPPVDDSYMDFNQPAMTTSGNPSRPLIDDSYMDFPKPPTSTSGNPSRPPIDDSYMDFNQPTTTATTISPGGQRPPIDDSYLDAPFRPQKPIQPVVVGTTTPDTVSTVTPNTLVTVVVPTTDAGTTTTTTPLQPPIVVNSGPQVSSQTNPNSAQALSVIHQVTQIDGGAGSTQPTIVTQGVAQPQPVDNRPIVIEAQPDVPQLQLQPAHPGALQAPVTTTTVATNPVVVAVPTIPVTVTPTPSVAVPTAQQPTPVVVQSVPQLPMVDRQPGNPGALQAPVTTTTVATQPVASAVPSIPVTVTPNQPIATPPAQQPAAVVVTAQPPLPVVNGPQNNPGALQGPNTPTVVATQPIAIAVPSLPVVVTNPTVVAQPPAQQTVPVVVSSVPQLPILSGPQNNPGALQGPNTPTVVATQPTTIAVPSLPVVVTNPAVIAQPPTQKPSPVVVTNVPSLPISSGPQNNPGVLHGPNTPTVIAALPTPIAVPSLPVVVANPPVVAQPPTHQANPVVVANVPQVPTVGGPQHNPGALQGPNTPTVVATQPIAIAVPSLPVVVTNPTVVAQPPAQQVGPVVVTSVPPLPISSGPQNNPGALQASNPPTVVATQPTAIAVPTLPVAVNNPPVVAQPPAQQPGHVAVSTIPQVPTVSGPQNNPGALQGPNTPTVIATQPTTLAVPSLPGVVNNSPVIAQPPAQQPVPIIVTDIPQLPTVSGPQNNIPALQGPNTPTVVAMQPRPVAVPSLPVTVANPPTIATPPAQQPVPVVVSSVPQVPAISGPQHNPGALQGPNSPTVVATQPTAVAVPTLPVVVSNPPVVAQPPVQQVGPVVVTSVPPLPISSGPQNNPGALQGPNLPMVVASQPTAVAMPTLPLTATPNQPVIAPPAQQPTPVVVQSIPQVPVVDRQPGNPGALQGPPVVTTTPQAQPIAVPTLPVVVNNPPVVAQPPTQQPAGVVVTAQPPLPIVTGPQNNPGALQGPNLPTVVASQPTAVAVPTLPGIVNSNPGNNQPPLLQPGPVVVTNLPPLSISSGPQKNPGAIQGPNTPTVVATQPTAVAVPTLPVVVTNLPPTTISSGPQHNPGAIQGPNPPTVTVTQTTPTQTTGPTSVDHIPPGQVDGGLVQTTSNQGSQTPTVQVGPQGPQQPTGHDTNHVAVGERQLVAVTMPSPVRESEIFGLRYNIVYRNYEAQSLVNDIGRPLYALASGYEFFLYLEGRPGQSVSAPAIKPAPTGQ